MREPLPSAAPQQLALCHDSKSPETVELEECSLSCTINSCVICLLVVVCLGSERFVQPQLTSRTVGSGGLCTESFLATRLERVASDIFSHDTRIDVVSEDYI